MSRLLVHPLQALFAAHERSPQLPVCDHYAGIENRMRRALELQGGMADQALFDVTLDLEDGAAIGGEHEHALLAAELISSAANRFGRVGVRVHGPHHPRFGDDVEILLQRAGTRLAYLMLPKCGSANELLTAVSAIARAGRDAGLTQAPPVHALIETHGALRDVAAIAEIAEVESLSFGLMDFVSAHRGAIPASAMRGTGQFAHPLVLRAKLEIAAACHAAFKVPSHCVITEYQDAAVIADAARRAATELGCTRMWSIHPNQIRPIVDAFAPEPEAIDTALEILLQAQAADWAPIAHRGLLQDRASFRYHWHIVERAARTGRLSPAQARAATFAPDAGAAG